MVLSADINRLVVVAFFRLLVMFGVEKIGEVG